MLPYARAEMTEKELKSAQASVTKEKMQRVRQHEYRTYEYCTVLYSTRETI